MCGNPEMQEDLLSDKYYIPKRESDLITIIQLRLSDRAVLFRNNVGMARSENRVIRYGVCNPGGADLIGWCKTTGKFLAIECKTKTMRLTKPQRTFLHQVKRGGGLSGVARCVADAEAILSGDNPGL